MKTTASKPPESTGVRQMTAQTGRTLSQAARAAQAKVTQATTALQSTKLTDNKLGHFVAGALEGTAGIAIGPVRIVGAALQLVDKDKRAHNGKAIDAALRHPLDSFAAAAKAVKASYEKDPSHFVGKLATVLLPGAVAKLRTGSAAAEVGEVAEASTGESAANAANMVKLPVMKLNLDEVAGAVSHEAGSARDDADVAAAPRLIRG